MNAQIQKSLSDLGASVAVKIEFAESVRISGLPGDGSPSCQISLDQPDCEVIFAVLQKIGLRATQSKSHPLRFPPFLNRAYQFEKAGEAAYKTRRVLRRHFNPERRAGQWALCAYPLMGCPDEFTEFLSRHPEQWFTMSLAWYALVKMPNPNKLSLCFATLYCMLRALLTKIFR